MPGGGGGGPPPPVVAAGALARPMERRKPPELVRQAKVCPIRIFEPLLRHRRVAVVTRRFIGGLRYNFKRLF
jgi:hypothetical protein